METKFTPGPWVATQWDGLVKGDVTGAEHKGTHASVHKASDLSLMIAPLGPVECAASRANAHLIAAAPDLYAALVEACEEILHLRNYANNHGGEYPIEDFTEGLAALTLAREGSTNG